MKKILHKTRFNGFWVRSKIQNKKNQKGKLQQAEPTINNGRNAKSL